MSILIRGIQMPSECRKCFMIDYAMTGETYCEVNGKTLAESYRPIEFDGRPDWCPLVELPEKHGRLIDGDMLEQEIVNGIKASNYEKGYEHYENINNMDDCVECVRYADTVIEAEGEG